MSIIETHNSEYNNGSRPVRCMWLLNHTSARKFEIPMLKKLGITEIFLPKIFPSDLLFRSASVDWSEDQYLTIPPQDLAVLNATNWYEIDPHSEAMAIANKHFDIVFFITTRDMFMGLTKYFNGAMILRAYGLDRAMSYDWLANSVSKGRAKSLIESTGRRFWLGQVFPNIHEVEPPYWQERRIDLPLGTFGDVHRHDWTGTDKSIFFVCPDINFNGYYKSVYDDFIKEFADFPYAIGGAQPVMPEPKPNVLGFVTREEHERNMRERRVMFYHSTEPRHLHYHPVEAIQAGMPLIFMAGGVLDQFGGRGLPGRCTTYKEARKKIRRILNDDRKFIEKVRTSQTVLLQAISREQCETTWRTSMTKVLATLEEERARAMPAPIRKKRIAVIVPVEYRGGSLRGAKILAETILTGSRMAGEEAEVVFGHLDMPEHYPDSEFEDLSPEIIRRPYCWRVLNHAEAARALHYAGIETPVPPGHFYAPDDYMQQFTDCDLWVVISDRLQFPLLPIRPYICMVYDYLQRYVPIFERGEDAPYLKAARNAEKVFVTTRFTEQDALNYAGVAREKVVRLPNLARAFTPHARESATATQPYFLWTTNAAPHKNHEYALRALDYYYTVLGGTLDCYVTGVNTGHFLDDDRPHSVAAKKIVMQSTALQHYVHWSGELPDDAYQAALAGAAFLWHAGRIDNGTFSVIEAAYLGVPALSSDYPAMREIDAQFNLNLQWMDANDPKNMALQLQAMETHAHTLRGYLPTVDHLHAQSFEQHALTYWNEVRACL